jgi:hypothetical protein
VKKLSKILAMILCVILLSGCGAPKLSDNYSEEKLKTASEEIIKNLDSEKYAEVRAVMDEKLKNALSEEKLKEVWGTFSKVGKYDSISKVVFGEKDGFAVVVVAAKYEKGKIQFTLSYNKDMQLAGIYLK